MALVAKFCRFEQMRRFIIYIIFVLGISSTALGQQDAELHFSHFIFNNLIINPAYAGKSNDISMGAFYRNQWTGFEGAPVTQTFSIHSPIPSKNFGVGFHAINDKIGIERHLALMFSGSYHIHMKKSVLSMGLSGGIKQFSIDKNELNLESSQVDPVYANMSTTMVPNFCYGMHWRTKDIFVAFSINNLNQPKLKYNDATISQLHRHYYLKTGYNYELNKNSALRTMLLGKYENGSPVQVYLNCLLDYQKAYWVGLGYRTGDAASIMVGAHLNKIKQLGIKQLLSFGYAFDWTINGLPQYNSGTHEIMLLYDIHLKTKGHRPKFDYKNRME